MTEINITQADADALIGIPKVPLNYDQWQYPQFGGVISIPLTSHDKRENFILDISQGELNLSKIKYQNRARQIIVLIRLDLCGPPHRNPDGNEISCPHLHIYREGFGDKWAYPIPIDQFPNIDQPAKTLSDFMKFCNIINPPNIQLGFVS
jgi:hypothetical protein